MTHLRNYYASANISIYICGYTCRHIYICGYTCIHITYTYIFDIQKISSFKIVNIYIIQIHSGKLHRMEKLEHKYQSVLPSTHHFYQLLQPKMNLLPHIFEIKQQYTPSTLPHQEFPFMIYCKQTQQDKISTFIYFYTLPCSAQAYLKITEDLGWQKKIDSNIDEYYQIQKGMQQQIQKGKQQQMEKEKQQNTDILYLSYKKMLIVAPRDFIYIRYKFTINNQTWIIASSDVTAKPSEGKIRAQIIFSATKIIENQKHIQVSVYSQVDMKMALKAETARLRGFSQIKKYVGKIYKEINNKTTKI